MSTVWVVVTLVGVATVAVKALGPVLLGGRQLPRPLAALLVVLAPALLAALVVSQTVGGDRELVFDERLPGLGAAALALALRAPLLAVVVIAAAVTAAARALG